MPHRRMLAAAAAVALVATAVAAPAFAQDDERPHGPPEATPNPVPHDVPAGDGTAVRLTTELGDVVIGLFNESAPVAAENFLNLANEGFYDGVGFHRSVPGFVLQGGDPTGTGGGGPDYRIQDEEVVGQYGRGIVAMARTQEPDSQGSQFFFVLDDSAEGALAAYDTYAIFGRVIEGMDVVDEIVAAREPSNQIPDPVRILESSVEQVELPPEPTAAPPSEAELRADELLATLPAEVAGLPLQLSASTSAEILASTPEDIVEGLTSVAEEQGGDVSQLTFASGGVNSGETFAIVLAATVPGVDATLIEPSIRSIVLPQSEDAVATEVEVGGRAVQRLSGVAGAGPDDTVHQLVSDDVLYFVVADADSLEAIVAELP